MSEEEEDCLSALASLLSDNEEGEEEPVYDSLGEQEDVEEGQASANNEELLASQAEQPPPSQEQQGGSVQSSSELEELRRQVELLKGQLSNQAQSVSLKDQLIAKRQKLQAEGQNLLRNKAVKRPVVFPSEQGIVDGHIKLPSDFGPSAAAVAAPPKRQRIEVPGEFFTAPILTTTTATLSVATTTGAPADEFTEKYSKVRLKPGRKVSVHDLDERLKQARIVTLAGVASAASLEGDWVCFGVIANKSEPKNTAKGGKFLILKLTDLKIGAMTNVSVFLFGKAFDAYWKEKEGLLVCVANAKMLPRTDAHKGLALSVSSAQQLCIIGEAADFDHCAGYQKNSMVRCQNVVAKAGSFCAYHVKAQYMRMAAGRMDLNRSLDRSFTMGLNNGLPRNLSSGTYKVGNMSESANPLAAKAPVSRIPKNSKFSSKELLDLHNKTSQSYRLQMGIQDKEAAEKQAKEQLVGMKGLKAPPAAPLPDRKMSGYDYMLQKQADKAYHESKQLQKLQETLAEAQGIVPEPPRKLPRVVSAALASLMASTLPTSSTSTSSTSKPSQKPLAPNAKPTTTSAPLVASPPPKPRAVSPSKPSAQAKPLSSPSLPKSSPKSTTPCPPSPSSSLTKASAALPKTATTTTAATTTATTKPSSPIKKVTSSPCPKSPSSASAPLSKPKPAAKHPNDSLAIVQPAFAPNVASSPSRPTLVTSSSSSSSASSFASGSSSTSLLSSSSISSSLPAKSPVSSPSISLTISSSSSSSSATLPSSSTPQASSSLNSPPPLAHAPTPDTKSLLSKSITKNAATVAASPSREGEMSFKSFVKANLAPDGNANTLSQKDTSSLVNNDNTKRPESKNEPTKKPSLPAAKTDTLIILQEPATKQAHDTLTITPTPSKPPITKPLNTKPNLLLESLTAAPPPPLARRSTSQLQTAAAPKAVAPPKRPVPSQAPGMYTKQPVGIPSRAKSGEFSDVQKEQQRKMDYLERQQRASAMLAAAKEMEARAIRELKAVQGGRFAPPNPNCTKTPTSRILQQLPSTDVSSTSKLTLEDALKSPEDTLEEACRRGQSYYEEPPKPKAVKSATVMQVRKKMTDVFGGLDMASAEAQKLLAARSIHSHLADQTQRLQRQELFDVMEKKEEMLEQMAATKSVMASAFECAQCHLVSECYPPVCRESGHQIKKIQAKKRFFQCDNCKQKTTTLNLRLPNEVCSHCRKKDWIPTGMMTLGVAKAPNQELLVRGEEHAFTLRD